MHTGEFRNGTPAAVAVGGDVADELLVFFGRPQPPLNLLFAAAVVPHCYSSNVVARPPPPPLSLTKQLHNSTSLYILLYVCLSFLQQQ